MRACVCACVNVLDDGDVCVFVCALICACCVPLEASVGMCVCVCSLEAFYTHRNL